MHLAKREGIACGQPTGINTGGGRRRAERPGLRDRSRPHRGIGTWASYHLASDLISDSIQLLISETCVTFTMRLIPLSPTRSLPGCYRGSTNVSGTRLLVALCSAILCHCFHPPSFPQDPTWLLGVPAIPFTFQATGGGTKEGQKECAHPLPSQSLPRSPRG